MVVAQSAFRLTSDRKSEARPKRRRSRHTSIVTSDSRFLNHAPMAFRMNPQLAWLERLTSLRDRLVKAGRNETSFDVRKVVAYSVSHVLPRSSFRRLRTAFLRLAGVRIGPGSAILGTLELTGPGDVTKLLRVGDGTRVLGLLHVDLGAEVRIGNGVTVGHDVSLLTIDHDIGSAEYRCGRLVAAPIQIGDGAWLGARTVVLPGVSIGAGAVVVAGAVVTRDVVSNTLVAGVPAKAVRTLDVADATPSAQRPGEELDALLPGEY
jgi:maltose O-acetyltransferase